MSDIQLGAGIHDIPPELYFADPCPEISLTSSGIKRLLSESPLEFSARNPRLTRWPELLTETSESMDLGSICHAIVLGRGSSFIVGDLADFRNKDGSPAQTWGSGSAKAWKREQEGNGFIVIDRAKSNRAEAAAQAMKDLLADEYGDWPLGESEQTLIWQENTSLGPIWCRALVDHLAPRLALGLDPKFTDLGLSDLALQKKAANEGLHIQQAWYERGIRACLPALTGHLTFRFPVAEFGPPYDARFLDLPEEWIYDANDDIERAIGRFAANVKRGTWPGYPRVCSPSRPRWMVAESENRALALMESKLEEQS